jgi:hypothetical protein
MSTRRQRRAARANGKKSQGPVTPEGKARSAVNATKHGLAAPGRLAASVCLTIESREEFAALHQTYIDLHHPTNPGEHLIVEEMAVARWHLQRAWVMQTALFENQMDEMTDQLARDYETMNEATRLTLAFKDLAEKSPSMPLLQRYEARLSRQIQRCQKQLADLRAATNPMNTEELSNGPNDPDPTNEHHESAPQHPDSAAPPADQPAQATGREPQQPPINPALAAPTLDLLPVGPKPAHSEARPGLPPALPRAA